MLAFVDIYETQYRTSFTLLISVDNDPTRFKGQNLVNRKLTILAQ